MDLERIWQLFQAGGIVMYPLVFCSILVLAVTLERHWNYKEAEQFRKGKDEFVRALLEGRWLEPQGASGPIAKLLKDAYSWRGLETSVQLQMFENTAASIMGRFRERISYLETIVTLAPLLGLLGTVVGMIQSFQVLAVKTGQMQAITGGVGEALVATATGLCVAVLALLCHSWLCQRLDRLAGDLEECGAALLTGSSFAAGRRSRETA
ncbi:MotA/TolQ/ExbB proton channel family protein [Anaeromusa sp.]|uniref:MotA/TolQ/ExbB proton channel family protein n=1 Tax=Anaeromusa sp. TaxID=1872520 RepID=UPI0026235A1D|nr:MotA/TolQ/ExbB proton channel family protein [Anaeromusa sp.]MDD3157394.1 MotA/TolQ/ExbB proton channel family protein [Anaeromusa sp.]